MLTANHPVRRILRPHGLEYLWTNNVLMWHHLDSASNPNCNPLAWVMRGSQQLAFTHSSDSGGKNVYDERLKQVANVAQNRIGFGCQIEPARTNKWLYANDLQNAGSHDSNVATNITVTDGGAAGPRADKDYATLTATANNGTFTQQITATADAWTISFWIKRRTGSGNVLMSANGTDWSAVTVTSNWTRVSLKQTATAAALDVGIKLATSGDAVDVECAQYELGTYASSHIATAGTAVTRTADAMRLINADVFGRMSTGGTLFYCGQSAYAPANHPGHRQPIAINYDNSLTEYAGFQFNAGAGVNGVIRADNATKYDQASGVAYSQSSPSAAALVWDGTRTELYVNGAIGNQSSAINAFPELDRIEIGRRVTADENFGGDSFAILCFDRALTERECIQLTQNPEVWKWGA